MAPTKEKPAKSAKPSLPKPALPKFSVSAQAKRNVRFFGAAGGISLIVFLFLGFTLTSSAPQLDGFLIALIAGPAIGVTAARLLYGWPRFETKEGKPLVGPRARPYLFFPLTTVFAGAFYVVLGVALSPVLPVSVVVYVPLAVGVLGGAALAYFLVGFPPLVTEARAQWSRVPPAHRPWLFFPFAVAFALVAYFLLGVALTNTPMSPTLQPLVALPLGAILGGVAAYFLVGFPKPTKSVREYVPDVPGRRRPLAFAVTFLVAGVPLSFLVGLALGLVPNFPHGALLPLALAAGYVAALGVAAAAWGTPKRWRQFADYKPGLPEGARIALFVPTVLALAVVGAATSAAVGGDMFLGVLVGTALGVLAGLVVSGAWARLRRARGASPTLLPELPDKVKPLVAFPVWFLTGGIVFLVLMYALPAYSTTHLIIAFVVGCVVSVGLVEEPAIREWLAARRAERERAAALEARRREALARVTGADASRKKA